jgi:hypothetical protein
VLFQYQHSIKHTHAMTDPIWLERVLEWYDNNTDAFVGEVLLCEVSLLKLQDHWHVPRHNPMVEMYRVTEEQRLFMEKQAHFQLDFLRFKYYLAATSTDLDAQEAAGGYMGLYAPPRILPAFPTATRVAPGKFGE